MQSIILDNLEFRIQSENDFQGLLIQYVSLHAFQIKKTGHESFSEYPSEGNKIDGLFLPIKGKSTTAIIHEYKQGTNNNYKNTLEDAIWQIYAKCYMSIAIKASKPPRIFISNRL